jgi:hypothetical protein
MHLYINKITTAMKTSKYLLIAGMMLSAGSQAQHVVTDDTAAIVYAADHTFTAESSKEQTAMLDYCMPNPVVTSCAVRYSIPAETTFAQVIVQDARGHVVFASDPLETGSGAVMLPTEQLPSGNYSYTLTADYAKVETRSMIIQH